MEGQDVEEGWGVVVDIWEDGYFRGGLGKWGGSELAGSVLLEGELI